ncbi:Cycloartenol synthase [Glycyrrhiza glabra] [Rhizoctonia solani]|uniref:Cycloartenol synthase [Glycyrrhiza glabra] n=1 Tax=Rhizoctonia solani TaxID=456999 RepID=A0A0K6FZG0_9AGAM|nr:Cycloartenol synthase [Glycyrrhiza glabra] [Rhizoctonia solani]
MPNLRRIPGALYRGANAFIVARTKLLNIKDPFQITFDGWGPVNPLYNWYTELANPYIHTMQLRKERESPFFHEFIAIRLRGDTYWRIDRRYLPDEGTPLNCIYTDGVPAHDTIEQVTSLESTLYASSDCLVELEFNVDVHVGLVLRICHAIQNHKSAKVFTLQRYNCYFFAQTVLLCTACGVSDWAGTGESRQGEREQRGPWKTPNAPVDFSKPHTLGNYSRLASFKWDSTESFTYDWSQLFKLSDDLVHASPMHRHANHCSYCLESRSDHQQPNLSSEVNRLKHDFVEYWNTAYREVLYKAYLANHRKLVESGVWGVVSENMAKEDCLRVVLDNLEGISSEWKTYSQGRFKELIAALDDLLDPNEPCGAWNPDPNEWKSICAWKAGGLAEVAKASWERGMEVFMASEITQLENSLKEQILEADYKAQQAAMMARLNSFTQFMNIKIRVAQYGSNLIVPEGTAPLKDEQSTRTKQSEKTARTIKTVITTRATQLKGKIRPFYGDIYTMEKADITKVRKCMEQLIGLHAARVEQYKVVLNCEAIGVQTDMREGVDDIWHSITR